MPNTTYGTPYAQSSDLVSNWPGVSSNVADRIDDVSFKGNGLNDQTGTSYTLVLTDAGKTVTLNNAAAVTVTIPTNASVAYEIGTTIELSNKGAGVVTVSPAGGVTLNNSVTLSQHASASIQKLDTNTWVMIAGISPGLSFVTSSTFSAATAVSLNNVFTSTYSVYQINAKLTASSAGELRSRLRLSGTDNTTASSYQRTGYFADSNTSLAVNGAATDYQFHGATAGSDGWHTLQLQLNAPALSEMTGMFSQMHQVNNNRAYAHGGVHTQAVAYDGITLYPSTGTITGTLRIYGYRNS